MGHYNDAGVWVEDAAPPPAIPQRRRMRPAAERQHDPQPGVRQQARREMRQGGYDNEGNWVEGAPATLSETVDDVWRSGVAGVQRGVAGMAGAQGDLRNAQRTALGRVIQAVAPAFNRNLTEEEADALASQAQTHINVLGGPATWPALIAPDSEQVVGAIERSAGPIHEPETTAGEYSRTIGEFAPGALFPGGPATRVARVVLPAVASEAAGQATEGTAAEPYARLVAGLGGGVATEGLISVLTRQGLTPDERSLRLIMRELEDQGMSTDEIVRQANVLTSRAPTEEVIAEVLGPGGLRMARAVANMGRGPGRAIADEALSVRAEGGRAPDPTARSPNRTRAVTSIRDRVMDETTAMTAPQQTRTPRNYWDALDALRTARSAQGSDAYRAMYAAAPDPQAVSQQLLPYLADAPAEAAASGARQLSSAATGLRAQRAAAVARGAPAQEVTALELELDDVVRAQRQLEGVSSGQLPNSMSSRAIDYYQRGLAQMERAAGAGSPEARALGDARRAYNQMADEIVPGFRDARTRYGDSMRVEEAMNDGRRVFDMSEGEIERVMRGTNGRGLPMEEFDGFMLGVLDAIERKLGQGDTAFLARLMRNQNWRNQITEAVGGKAQARRFFDRLAREANMQGTRNYIQRGSQTTPIAEDIAALTQGESEFAFMSDNARRLIASGGQLRPLVIRWALDTFERFNRPGLRNPEVQEALARRLFSRVSRNSARELRDALEALKTDRDVPQNVRDWLQRVNTANAATMDERLEGEPAPDADASSEDTEGSIREFYMNARDAANAPAGRAMNVEAEGQSNTIIERDGKFYVGSRGFDTMPEAEAYARFVAAQSGRAGDIDTSRPALENSDGSYSTERTITIEADGKFYVLPTIVGGRQLSEDDAIAAWRRGENQPVREPFNTQAEADAYARFRSARIPAARQAAGAQRY